MGSARVGLQSVPTTYSARLAGLGRSSLRSACPCLSFSLYSSIPAPNSL